jgi:hypothetical protein
MNSLTTLKHRTAQTVALVSALAFAGIAQAQSGNDSGGSSSSSSTNSSSSGQSSQKQKSYDQSNAADKGQERDKMEGNVKDTIKRDKEHNLSPGQYTPK